MWTAGILFLISWLGGVRVPLSTKPTPFVDALCSGGPAADQKDKMTLSNSLLGDWDVEVFDYAPDGTRQRSNGEWHFSWVLDGRAIQDVFIVPSRAERQAGSSVKTTRFGTSLRVYDPAAGVWHVTWINPVSGAHNMLVGRKDGDEILQEGQNPDGSAIRWIFSDVTPNSFHWRGEVSSDSGKTWHLGAEFFGRRIVASSAGK